MDMRCNVCGAEMKPGKKFCKKCGSPVRIVEPIKETNVNGGEPSAKTGKLVWLLIGIVGFATICTGFILGFVLMSNQKKSSDIDDFEGKAELATESEPISGYGQVQMENEEPEEAELYPDSASVGDPDMTTYSGYLFDYDVYRRFIEEELYLYTGEGFFEDFTPSGGNSFPISYALHDMDGDSIPELLVNNGGEGYATNETYAYGYTDITMIYLGTLPGCFTEFRYGNDVEFPGIFVTGAHTGVYWTDYYCIRGDMVQQIEVEMREDAWSENGFTGETQQVSRTDSDSLFNANSTATLVLDFVSVDDYKAMTWNSFVDKYGYKDR